jgi:plastocyanin
MRRGTVTTTSYKLAAGLGIALTTLATAGLARGEDASPARAPRVPQTSQPASGAPRAPAPPAVPGAQASAPEAAPAPPRVLAVLAQAARPKSAPRHRGRTALRRSATARAAAGSSVTIRDFSFGPSAITVHAGDTVTWTNGGHANHTATGAGVFDTGILHTGQSASQTFTHTGTFSYRCSVHPFMRGVVTVLAAPVAGAKPASGSASGTGASGQVAQPAAAATAAQGPTLPATGFDTRAELGAGLAMLALGAVLLMAARPARHPLAGARGQRTARRRLF